MTRRQPRKRAGTEIEPVSDAELSKLSEIAPEDVERAKASWRKHASPLFKDLLEAEPTRQEKGKQTQLPDKSRH